MFEPSSLKETRADGSLGLGPSVKMAEPLNYTSKISAGGMSAEIKTAVCEPRGSKRKRTERIHDSAPHPNGEAGALTTW